MFRNSPGHYNARYLSADVNAKNREREGLQRGQISAAFPSTKVGQLFSFGHIFDLTSVVASDLLPQNKHIVMRKTDIFTNISIGALLSITACATAQTENFVNSPTVTSSGDVDLQSELEEIGGPGMREGAVPFNFHDSSRITKTDQRVLISPAIPAPHDDEPEAIKSTDPSS
tara:strand:+ start:88 stop:603 length:516 start_codon:yes stop_codon:yes gene_type:complete